jgi:Ala-tRNA(Pro) deacylase
MNSTHPAASSSICEDIQTLLDASNIPYRAMQHEPAGPVEQASQVRGNSLKQAAKAMVVFAALSKHSRQYVLAVVSGDRRIDMNAIRSLLNASYVGLAPAQKAEELTGCVMGAVPPFTFHPQLELMVDRRLMENEEIVFNAGRLDLSIFLSPRDYISVANPTLASISKEETL